MVPWRAFELIGGLQVEGHAQTLRTLFYGSAPGGGMHQVSSENQVEKPSETSLREGEIRHS